MLLTDFTQLPLLHYACRSDKVSNKLEAHYLGGRLFGPIMTAGTLFASMFSGYTTVGIPNEAYKTGWLALRWVPSFGFVAGGVAAAGLRMRKASVVRNHSSPSDFITDRYQSNCLRYTIVFLQTIPSLFYLVAQVVAIKNTFNAMFNLDPEASWPSVLIMFLILCFEFAGGLSSVAITDSIQAFVIILSFVTLPIVMRRHFGGWYNLDPFDYPRPDFYQTPTKEEQWRFWQFTLINSSFFTLPHFIQRNYSSKNLASLKIGWITMTVGVWATMFVGCYIGTVGVEMLKDEPEPPSPITAILYKVIELGGFAEVVGIIALTASLAAIMSTADSLIIAISQLLTSEVCYPLRPKSTPREIAWWGRGVSLFTVCLALMIGLLWKGGVSALGAIQFPLSMLCVLPFLSGLYAKENRDFHPWCLSMGAAVAAIYVFVIFFTYLDVAEDPSPINAGMTGIALQFVITCILEGCRRLKNRNTSVGTAPNTAEPMSALIFPNRPSWDIPSLSRFGSCTLTSTLLEKMMAGVSEPLSSIWYAFLLILTFSLTTPLVAENQPPLIDGVFSTDPPVFRGLPWFAFKIILMCILPYGVMLLGLWYTPSEFPADAEKIEKDGVDPNTVELTQKELGRRVSYDEPNELAFKRRSTIRETMLDLGIKLDPVVAEEEEENAALIKDRRRFSSLVLGKIDVIPEESDESPEEIA